MTAPKPEYREHPALIAFYLVGGLVLAFFGALLLYAGSHPPPEARHGAVVENILGFIVAPAGVLAVVAGTAMWLGWRFISIFQALPLIWAIGSLGLLALLLFR